MGLVVLILCFSQGSLHAQISSSEANIALKKSIDIQKSGMIVLGSWAILNIISGTAGYYTSNNDKKYFHQMNSAWNLVNLGIAGFGYRGALNTDLNLDYDSALVKMQSFEKILLINAGLDVLYIGTGVYLWKKGLSDNSDRLMGYGKSIVLQGGFLLLFDTTLYLIHRKETQSLLQITDQLSFTGTGLIFSF